MLSTMERDPEHSIIERPWEYSLANLHVHCGLDGSEPFVDMALQRGDVVRRLRFWSPQDFEIEEGCFPAPTGGMMVLDVTGRQLDRLGVRVVDVEGTRGALTFWARDVVDLDTVEGA